MLSLQFARRAPAFRRLSATPVSRASTPRQLEAVFRVCLSPSSPVFLSSEPGLSRHEIGVIPPSIPGQTEVLFGAPGPVVLTLSTQQSVLRTWRLARA